MSGELGSQHYACTDSPSTPGVSKRLPECPQMGGPSKCKVPGGRNGHG